LPPELVDPGWGIEEGPQPPDTGEEPPHIDHTLPGDLPHPEHPIVLPPDLPDGPPSDAHPAHPIYIDAYPDNSLPPGLEAVGELEFYQRKTVGINWDASFDPAKIVGVYASTDGENFSEVRTVANDGSSSVTYPQDFTGEVYLRVSGINGYLEGSYTVV
jgi:hypothetical protein